MTSEPKWLGKKALLLLHEESLAQFGGKRGLRDEGLFNSALARPQNLLAYNQKTDIPALAAAYAYGLARNHPFVDGNKRMAFLSIGVFLRVNGHELRADKVDAIQAMLALADGRLEEDALADWIRKNSGAVKKK